MKDTFLTHLHHWSVWQSDRRIDFNGFYLSRPQGGGICIDPMPMTGDQEAFVRSLGGVDWVLLTNADHLRAAPAVREAFGAKVCAPACERGRLGPAADQVDVWFHGTDDLPGELSEELEVRWVRGGKSELEAVFYFTQFGALLFGDVVRSHVTGELCLLPDGKISDAALVREDLAELLELASDVILLGDGDSIWQAGGEAFEDLLGSI